MTSGPHGAVCFLISEMQGDNVHPLVNDFIASRRESKVFLFLSGISM